MASSFTDKEEELLEKIRAYERDFAKHSFDSFEAMKRNDQELQLQCTYAAVEAGKKRKQVQKELDELKLRQRMGAAAAPKEVPPAVHVSSSLPACGPEPNQPAPASAKHPLIVQQEQGAHHDSRSPHGSWGGASPDSSSSSGGSSSSSRQGADISADVGSPGPSSQQQAWDHTGSRKSCDEQCLHDMASTTHSTPGGATDASGLVGAAYSETELLLPAATNASSSVCYPTGSASAGGLRRRLPQRYGGM